MREKIFRKQIWKKILCSLTRFHPKECLIDTCLVYPSQVYSTIKKFLLSEPEEYRNLKGILGFFYGCFLGIILYYACISRLFLVPASRVLLGIFVIVSLGFAFVRSMKVRCLMLLVIPLVAGKSGRAILLALAVAFMISGPVHGIVKNTEEVVRVLTCTATINFNLTVQRFKLMYSPVKDVVYDFVKGTRKTAKLSSEMSESFAPVKKEVEDDSSINQMEKRTEEIDSKRGEDNRVKMIEKMYSVQKKDSTAEKKEKKYKKKLSFRCEDIFNLGVRKCEDRFFETEMKCYETLPIIGAILCWPMKLTFICKIVSWIGGLTVCNAAKVVEPGFGEAFEAADNATRKFRENFHVAMEYKLVRNAFKLDAKTAKGIALAIKHDLEVRKQYFLIALQLSRVVLSFAFIFIFSSSVKYLKNYLEKIEFDNVYITPYFRRIDARRKLQIKKTLLPLKKIERMKFIGLNEMRLMKAEKRKFDNSLLYIIPQIFATVVVIAVNSILSELLFIIREHSMIEYEQTGYHRIKLLVEGSGLIARLIRKLLKGFDKQKRIHNIVTTEGCLPNPVTSNVLDVSLLIFISCATLFLLYYQAYCLRLRSVICGYFYHKRYKTRTLSLYNDILKKRKGFLKYMRHQVRKKARKRTLWQKQSIGVALRLQFPTLCNWLRWIGQKRKCLVCGELETKDFQTCPNELCKFVYCEECWVDLKRHCYACMPETSDEEESDITDETVSYAH